MHVTRLNLAPPYEYAAIPQQIDHALPSIKGRLAFDRQRRQPPPWPAFHRCKRSEWPIPRGADRVTPRHPIAEIGAGTKTDAMPVRPPTSGTASTSA